MPALVLPFCGYDGLYNGHHGLGDLHRPQDAPPLPLLVVLFGIPAGCIIGTLKVLVDRLKEIGKGEEDAYRNY